MHEITSTSESSFTRSAAHNSGSVAVCPESSASANAIEAFPGDLQVLVVDDNAVNRRIAGLMLKKMGLNADEAENGVEAVKATQSKAYDIILMDLQMPVMGGLEATEMIREDSSIHQPIIIAVTAHAFPEDREACIEAGMQGFVPKPVDLHALYRTIGVLAFS